MTMQPKSDLSFDLSYTRCVQQLNWAVASLEGVVQESHSAVTAELIIQSMTGAWRFFHTPEHIFEVGRGGDAIEVLAALFHDAIHIQADSGVGVNIGMLIAPFIRETGKALKILPSEQAQADPVFEMVCMLFDFSVGQTLLPAKGQNEFLSALVAARSMAVVLDLKSLTKMAACIEATIPFRKYMDGGLKPSEVLRQRLCRISERFAFGWDAQEIDGAVRRAVRLANRDVENFSHPASAEFLNNTWNLMPETNHELLGAYSYTVSGYRKSLQKMESFMLELTPAAVFQQYQQEPSAQVFSDMLARTDKNLSVARLYLGSKLLSIAIIEAVSLRLGSEIPLATMMGELPQRGTIDAQLETFLPLVPNPFQPQGQLEQEVLALLETGRTLESDYDVKHSPVASFVVRSIGFAHAQQLLEQARAFFDQQVTGEQFLHACHPEIVEAIVNGACQVFEIRRKAIRNRST
jgi:hypothetical protein